MNNKLEELKKLNIAVFMGGTSSEREVSLKSGTATLKSLQRQGFNAYGVELTEKNIVSAFIENNYDLAYLVLHGGSGENGEIQGLLELLKKPYTGSGVTGSAIAMDKKITKIIAESIGIRVAKTYNNENEVDSFPVIVKPAAEGSSVGLHICNDAEELKVAVKSLLPRKVIIEEFIKGEELTAGVLNGESLGVLKINFEKNYDYEAKYTVGGSTHEFPAKILKSAYDEVVEMSLKIHEKLELKGMSRSDFILKDGKPYFLEVNTCPGMTELSLIPDLGTIKGYTYDDLTRKMVETFAPKK